MQHRYLSGIASLVFAAFWAALIWSQWTNTGDSGKLLLVPWLLCAGFLLLAGGLVAGKRWARWVGLAAAIALLALLSIGLVGAYFISFFGDQALDIRIASWFLAGIALAVAQIALLARPLDSVSPAKQAGSAERDLRVWIPMAFSVAYVVGSLAVGVYTGSGTWEGLARDIGVDVALLFVALPSILLVWLAWAWWSRGKVGRPLGVLLAAGFIIPFAVAGVAFAIVTTTAASDQRRTAHQLANAHLSDVTDEVLTSARGNPIGIRLRYTVRFAEGLDDVRYRPIVTLRFESPLVDMWMIHSQTEPPVGARFDTREYRMTEDFIPGYFPGFMRFPEAPQRADDKCFYWGRLSDRATVKETETLHATINMSFATAPDRPVNHRRSTALAYSQDVFYNGALREGARDCQ